MATWENQSQSSTSTPQVKFEASPTESFLSTPGELYPSLFATPVATTDPIDSIMTPESFADEENTATTPTPDAPGAETEKKPAKKRKSWGQVLPEPKTNLPPRKRAKTEDEKEQRRVERVLRNRRAAQSSRERKRQEVEALEQRNADLEAALSNQKTQNRILREELSKLQRGGGVVTRSSSPLDVFQPSPLTLSQPLFHESANGAGQTHTGLMEDFILMPEQDGTVNPASISPELNPVADSDMKSATTTTAAETETGSAPVAVTTSPDATQHPAVSVSRSNAVVGSSETSGPVPPTSNVTDGLFGADFSMLPTSDIDNWGAQDQPSPSADPLNFEYNHLASDATTELPEFDINQFLSDDVSGAASGATAGNDSIAQEPDSTFSFFDFENQIPTETFNQQPHPGASTYGCDDGVLAVGV